MTPTDEPIVFQPPIPPFELWVGVVALYAGLSHFLSLPGSGGARAVELAFPLAVTVWSLLYALGGLCVVLGLIRRSPRLEGAGLQLLGAGIVVSTIAVLVSGAAILPTLIGQGFAAVCCAWRLAILGRLA